MAAGVAGAVDPAGAVGGVEVAEAEPAKQQNIVYTFSDKNAFRQDLGAVSSTGSLRN